MKRFRLLPLALSAGCLLAGAQINSPVSPGYLDRGVQMYNNGNYQGCLDQLKSPDVVYTDAGEMCLAAWLRAAATYRSGLPEARGLLLAFAADYPSSPRAVEARLYAINCIVESNPAEALMQYLEFSDGTFSDALDADLSFHMAYARLRTGQTDAARDAFNALRTDRQYGAAATFYSAYIAYVDRDYATARKLFEQCDRTTAPGSAADYYLAQIYYVDGDTGKALKYARALLANPVADDSFTAEANRIAGESLAASGDIDKAIPYLKKYAGMAENPELSALYLLGTYEYNHGNYSQAISWLEPVTASQSAMGQSAYLFIGQALMESGRKDAALMAFDSAINMEYDNAVQEAAFYNYAVAKFSGASLPFGSSVATFEEFLRRYPDGQYATQVQDYLVNGYLTEKNYEAALQSIEKMKSPSQKVLAAKQFVLYALGTRALSTGDYSGARKHLSESLRLSRHDAAVAARTNLSLGEAAYHLGDYSTAVSSLGSYLAASSKDDVNRPLARYDLGYAYFATKNYRDAASNFNAVVDKPGNLDNQVVADALNRLGDIYLYENSFDKAAAYYSKAYDRNPSAGDYSLFRQAQIKGYARDYSGKISGMTEMIDRFPTSSLVPEALLEMTEGYLQSGRPDDAVAVYRRIVADYPSTGQGRRAYVQMGMTLLNLGRYDDAVEAYREVIRKYPTSEEARIAAGELERLAAKDGTLADHARFLASVENAPKLDVKAADRLTFEAAEEDYVSDKSVARLEKYISDFPDGTYVANALGYLMEDASAKGQAQQALSYARRIVVNYPDSRLAETALAVKAESEESLGKGIESLDTWSLLATRASDPATLNKARKGVMRVARGLGDYDKVIDAAQALLSSSTLGSEDRSEAIFSLGLAYDGKGDVAAARETWSRISGDTDNVNGVKSAYYLAQSLFDSGDAAAAEKGAKAIIDSSTPHIYWLARGFILLSDVYAARGDRFEAREYLRSLRDNYPGQETDIYQMIDSRLSNLK